MAKMSLQQDRRMLMRRHDTATWKEMNDVYAQSPKINAAKLSKSDSVNIPYEFISMILECW